MGRSGYTNVGNTLTLLCKCGREYSGHNAKLVHKLLKLHAKTAHGDIISINDINIMDTGSYDVQANNTNARSLTHKGKTAKQVRDDLKTALNWVACA